VRAIYKAIGAVEVEGEPGFWQFPCDQVPSIGFQFGGQNFMMDPQDFIIAEAENVCVGVFIELSVADGNEEELAFLLGAPFIKNFVTVFDLGTPAIAFGNLKASNHVYGSATIIQNSQRTALGTGPFATLSPTLTVPTAGMTVHIIRTY
jgi:Eukaryotic aspartyl protease